LLLALSGLGACSGVAAPAGGSSAGGVQGGGSAAATSAASQGNADGQGGGAATVPAACSLLTPDEIKAQFTFDVSPGVASSPGGPICNWNSIEYHPSFGGVQLSVEKLDQGYYDFVKQNARDPKEVPGLGDGAVFIQATNPFTLQMKKGNLMFTLYVVAAGSESTTVETRQQAVIALANDVLGHL
jgi:hypothetical protein